jgi:hypothetical protein
MRLSTHKTRAAARGERTRKAETLAHEFGCGGAEARRERKCEAVLLWASSGMHGLNATSTETKSGRRRRKAVREKRNTHGGAVASGEDTRPATLAPRSVNRNRAGPQLANEQPEIDENTENITEKSIRNMRSRPMLRIQEKILRSRTNISKDAN